MTKSFLQQFNHHRRWLFPCLFMILIAPFTPYIDLSIANYFYSGVGTPGMFVSNGFTSFIFDCGVMPCLVLTGLSVVFYLASFFSSSLKQVRQAALCFILTVAIGSGLLIHAAFKDHWGRPRPKQLIEFGGTEDFRPFYSPRFDQTGLHDYYRSFPCGHCSMGFAFFTLYLLGIRHRKKGLAYGSLASTWVLGGLLSITRMAQGGHFFSDVLVSALIMWLTALVIDEFVHRSEEESERTY